MPVGDGAKRVRIAAGDDGDVIWRFYWLSRAHARAVRAEPVEALTVYLSTTEASTGSARTEFNSVVCRLFECTVRKEGKPLVI